MSTQTPDITEVPEHMWPRHHTHGWRCCGSYGLCRVTGQEIPDREPTLGRYLVATTAITAVLGAYLLMVV